MVIAIVGRSYSCKHRVAKSIHRYFDGRFKRLKFYSTDAVYGTANHEYMSLTDYWKLPKEAIMYETEGRHGNKLFATYAQLRGGNFTYVVDDPVGVARLDFLGGPYAVIYTTAGSDSVRKRASKRCDILDEVKVRHDKIVYRLLDFEKAGKYNMYLDTSGMPEGVIRLATDEFCGLVKKWVETRHCDEMHMPFICEVSKPNWYRAMRDANAWCNIGGNVQ